MVNLILSKFLILAIDFINLARLVSSNLNALTFCPNKTISLVPKSTNLLISSKIFFGSLEYSGPLV